MLNCIMGKSKFILPGKGKLGGPIMKKRLISMLLTVLMVVSLFSGLSVSAYADADYSTVDYTIAKGDTLVQICKKLGIEFYSCQAAINKLNNLTESQYRKLSVGQVLKMPATNADAVKIAASTVGSTGSTGTVVSGGSTVVSGTSNLGTANVAYWLISYTMQKGETVAGVCNTLGISFSAYGDQIKSLNNISSWSKVAAGKTLLLPSATAPTAGTSCYAVVAHYVSKGETTYNICQNYGINYNANTSLLQGLNPKVSLTNVKYGTTLLVPVPTVVTTGSTIGGNAGTVVKPGTGTTTNNGNAVTGKTYKLSNGTVSGGKINFQVNGVTVTAATAGSKVTVVPVANSGKAIESYKVVYADGSAVLPVSKGSFTMPECDVRVDATFSSGYNLIASPSSHGSVSFTVNGVATTTAVKGAEVMVVPNANNGYAYQGATVRQFKGGPSTIVNGNLAEGKTFTMPASDVIVYSAFESVKTYGFTKQSDGNGSYTLQVKGAEVTSASKGAVVKVVSSSSIDSVTVTADNGETVTVSSSDFSFTMPASRVTVKVTFKDATNTITVNAAANGSISAPKNAKPGETVTVKVTPNAGYTIDEIKILSGDTYVGPVNVTSPIEGTFTMPSSNITLIPSFKLAQYTLTVESDWVGCFRVRYGNEVKDFTGGPLNIDVNYGQTVSFESTNENKYTITKIYKMENGVEGAEFSNPMTMPQGNTIVRVKMITLEPAPTTDPTPDQGSTGLDLPSQEGTGSNPDVQVMFNDLELPSAGE